MWQEDNKRKEYNKTGFAGSDTKWLEDIVSPGERIDSLPRVDNSGWGNETLKYVSLYEFLGKNAGKDIGQRVWNSSKVMGVSSIKKEHKHSGSGIKYRHYPQAWLEVWFRDFDAQLSMEVYNKEVAMEALKRINKNSK